MPESAVASTSLAGPRGPTIAMPFRLPIHRNSKSHHPSGTSLPASALSSSTRFAGGWLFYCP
ncbi:hypothetical protein CsSME_00019991 [Camellia sinensis var. sinensis]